jgi:small-conductance mechanosensitive channel
MLAGLIHLGLCMVLLLGPSPRSASLAPSPREDPGAPLAATQDASEDKGYPVRLDGETVIWVERGIGPISAKNRARLAAVRLKRIADDPFYTRELVRVEVDAESARIYYRDDLVGMMTIEDAASEGLTPQEAAEQMVASVTDAIARYRARRMPAHLWRAGLTLLGATLVTALLILLLRRAHRRLVARIEEGKQGALARKLKQRLGVPPGKVAEYQRRVLRLVRGFLVLVIVLAWLQVAFSAVPMTRGYAFAFLRYLIDPVQTLWLGFLEHVGDLFFILVVLVLTWYLLRAMRWIAGEARAGSVSLPGVAPEFALPLYKILRLVVIAFAAMIAYPYIPGSSSGAFKGISLFAGALFTLGASGTAGNFIGGIVLVFMGIYRLGDRIRLGDVMGDVVEMNLLVTRVRTPKNEVVSLPNAAILGGQLVNYSTRARQEGVILHTTVSIGYDTPWRQVHELLLAAARGTDGVVELPAPYVLQTELGDFCVNYQVNAYTRSPSDMSRIYSQLHQRIQDEFHRAGVQIMSPHYVADPSEPKVVPPEKWADEGSPPRQD